MLQLFNRADLWRRPERLTQLSTCYRLLRSAKTQPSRALDWIEACRTAVLAVSIRPLQQQGISGAALGQALQQARLEAITQALHSTID